MSDARCRVLALAVGTVAASVGAGACANSPRMADQDAGPGATSAARSASAASNTAPLPAGAADARARIERSPRHGEWAMVRTPAADGRAADSVRAWVVYPERATKAPVVVVVHEIFGLTTWVRAVADQLAADGFIAIAPDLLTGKTLPGAPDSLDVQQAVAVIGTLDPAEVQRRLSAVASYGMALPAAAPRYGIVGFCWGGGTSFAHAVAAPALGASVVYYGPSPEPARLASVRAPVLGLYAQNDARVNNTVPPADSAMRALGKTFETVTLAGAGHGFLRQQDGAGGANLEAARGAWPRTVAWFRRHLEQ